MKRILIVDDDPGTRRVLGQALQPLGADIHFCEDGLDALNALRRSRYDLLVTDLSMPILDGRQLVRSVLDDPGLRTMPILVTSGISSGREITDLLHAGVCGFLAKPLNAAAVRADVSACLNGFPALSV